MSLCIIKYTYTRYAGVDIEKCNRGLFEYVKEEFGEFRPQMSEPGTIPDMPDYLDIVLCKKDGSIFYEMDIQRRAINIPLDTLGDGQPAELPDLDQRIYVYCRSGRRSATARSILTGIGYTDVVDFGGILDWDGEIEY